MVEDIQIHVQESLLQGHRNPISGLLLVIFIHLYISRVHLVEQQGAEGQQMVKIVGLAAVAVTVHRRNEEVAEREFLKLHGRHTETVGTGQFGTERQHLGGKVGFHQRVGKDIVDILAIVGPADTLLACLVVQARDDAHERNDARAAKGVAQCDIEQRHIMNRMEQRHQQALVGEHYRRLDARCRAWLPHEFHLVKCHLCLPHCRGYRYHLNLRAFSLERLDRHSAETLAIAVDEQRSWIVRSFGEHSLQARRVPPEVGDAFTLEAVKQLDLGSREDAEAHKHQLGIS